MVMVVWWWDYMVGRTGAMTVDCSYGGVGLFGWIEEKLLVWVS